MVHGTSAMADFKISQLFGIPLKPNRVKIVVEVKWEPPSTGWIRINCDGSSIGSPSIGSIGFVIRDAQSNFLGAYAQNIGHATALGAEFSSCVMAIEKALELHLNNLWIETDSITVVKAFRQNCLIKGACLQCKFTHIHREGNLVADSLAKNGQQLALYSSQWWEAPPLFVLSLLYRDNMN